MILGIGTDIIEIERIKNVSNYERFVNRILSDKEKELFYQFKSEKRQQEFLAGRFAVKEALYKALGVLCDQKEFIDFCILNNEQGAPYLAYPKIEKVHISISHCEHYATAFVIYEKSQNL